MTRQQQEPAVVRMTEVWFLVGNSGWPIQADALRRLDARTRTAYINSDQICRADGTGVGANYRG